MEIEATTFQKRRRSSSIPMHKESRILTKSKSKIRIIHLFAPEIIKTDVSNFREIVQHLTGKEEHQHHDQKSLKRKPRSRETHDDQVQDMNKSHGFCINSEEEAMMSWNGNVGEMSSGGFLNGLAELDGFIQELDEFPYLPFTLDPTVASSSSSSSHLHGGVFAESHHFA